MQPRSIAYSVIISLSLPLLGSSFLLLEGLKVRVCVRVEVFYSARVAAAVAATAVAAVCVCVCGGKLEFGL